MNAGPFNQWAKDNELLDGTETDVPSPASILAPRRFDITKPPPKPRPIFQLNDAVIATLGNLQALSAQSKAGKTAFVGAMIASTMEPTGDTLGVHSSNPDGAAVVHFDTEQSPYDHYRVIMVALQRAGRVAPPEWLRSYTLADVGTSERMGLLRFELEAAKQAHGAIHSVLFDGVADFVHDPNDPEECFAFVGELHRMAIQHATTIVCVLHENPGSTSGKTRGHLGSQLERKAETNLKLEKGGDAVTVVFTERARHAHVPKERGPCFAWNGETGMHLSVATKAAGKLDAKRVKLEAEAAELFSNVPVSAGLTWTELHKRIQKENGIKRDGARKRFDRLLDGKVIRKSGEKYYRA